MNAQVSSDIKQRTAVLQGSSSSVLIGSLLIVVFSILSLVPCSANPPKKSAHQSASSKFLRVGTLATADYDDAKVNGDPLILVQAHTDSALGEHSDIQEAEASHIIGIVYYHSSADRGDARIEKRQFKYRVGYYIQTAVQKGLFDVLGTPEAAGALAIETGNGTLFQDKCGCSAENGVKVDLEFDVAEGFPPIGVEVPLADNNEEDIPDAGHGASKVLILTSTDQSEHHQHPNEDSNYSFETSCSGEAKVTGGSYLSDAQVTVGMNLGTCPIGGDDQFSLKEAFTFLPGY